MRISNFHALMGAAVILGAVSFNVVADDTDSQAKARELLRQKIADLNGQPNNGNNTAQAPAPAPAPVAPTPAPVPVSMAPAGVSQLSPEETEKARELLRKKIAELNAGVTPVPSRLSSGQENSARETVRQERAKALTAEQAGAEAAGKQKADAALAAKAKQSDKPAMTTASTKSATPAPANFAPGSKEQRLYDLLQQYKADKVTPAEYHEQRAKILAE